MDMNRFGWASEADNIRSAWIKPDRSGRMIARDLVTDDMVDQTSAAGSPMNAKQRILDLVDAGVTLPIIMFPFGADKMVLSETLEAIAPKNIKDR